MKNDKYGLQSLDAQFPTEESCLKYIFSTMHSHVCSCGGTYQPLFATIGNKLEGRRQYQCSKCRFQIAPMVGTIFQKSSTPLNVWFKAVLAFSNGKSGMSAKYMQRELEVTYKCAYRILSLIRQSLKQDSTPLSGTVEMDGGYFGGKGSKKVAVLAAVERGGNIKARVVFNEGVLPVRNFLLNNVSTVKTKLMTDKHRSYAGIAKDYHRHSVIHSKKEWVRGKVHVNTIETFFSHLKRSIKGTFKSVSKKHLQTYLDAFVFHYNNRHSDKQRFALLLGNLLHVSE